MSAPGTHPLHESPPLLFHARMLEKKIVIGIAILIAKMIIVKMLIILIMIVMIIIIQ